MTQVPTVVLNGLARVKNDLIHDLIIPSQDPIADVNKAFDSILIDVLTPSYGAGNGEATEPSAADTLTNQAEPRDQYLRRVFPQVNKFTYGAKSIREMHDVLPNLIGVAKLGLAISTNQDWTFYDGVRTHDEQIANIKAGVSSTLNSLHLPQSDGLSHAMDLVPIIDGLPKWDWDGCYRVANLVMIAAIILDVADQIVWGGCWYLSLKEIFDKFGYGEGAMQRANEFYVSTHPGKDFIDGPHFQWGGKMEWPK